MPNQARNWFITVFVEENEQREDDTTGLSNRVKECCDKIQMDNGNAIRYMCGQLERCPTTNRAHAHLYVEFTNPWRFNRVKRTFGVIGTSPSVEIRRGSRNEAREYATKSESRIAGPWEWGTFVRDGQKRSIEEIKNRISEGATELEIADEFFGEWCRYRKSFARYRTLCARPRNWKTRTVILWGDSGTGKTRSVYDYFGNENVYDVPRPNGGNVWFDNYNGQRVVLLDDFYGWLPLHFLLKIADRYAMQVPCKGGFRNFNPEYLCITSNSEWTNWYKWPEFGERLLAAWKRRIDRTIFFRSGMGPRIQLAEQSFGSGIDFEDLLEDEELDKDSLFSFE
jgi:hypothetical protein